MARLAIGQGVFVDVGGVLEKAAQTTDASPGGGTFVDFPSASEINDASAVAFVANVNGDLPWRFRPVQRSVTLHGAE